MIVKRFVAHYACANCDALFTRLSTANEHVRSAHMRDSATQHEVSDCATELSFNDALLATMSQSNMKQMDGSTTKALNASTRKRKRSGNRANRQKG